MYLLPINQRDLETVLHDRAIELGADVRRGSDVLSFSQDQAHVEVVVRGSTGLEETIPAKYLVGCDGGNSSIRRELGIGFPGSTDEHAVDRSALIGASDQFHLVSGGRVWINRVGEIPVGFYRTGRRVFTFLAHDPERPLINTAEREEHPAGNFPGPGTPMTMSEMEDSVERVLGVRVPLTAPPPGAPALLRRLCRRNSRVAERYRVGRVFIAGDAAHVSHGPTLNLALQDSANLGWKLAAAVAGWGSEALLDSYGTERVASAERVIMWTQAESALLAPGADVTELRELVSELLGPNLQMFADLVAGSDVRYAMGQADSGPPTGRFVPPLDLTMAGGRRRRVAELLRSGRPLLLDMTGRGELAGIADPWAERVDLVLAKSEAPPAPALLVRPDGYVAWAGRDRSALLEALARWFGTA